MVATDVASRGIGMVDRAIAHPPPSPGFLPFVSCGASCVPMLTAPLFSAYATIWSRLVMKLSSQAKCPEISFAVWLATFLFPPRFVSSGYRGGLGPLPQVFKLHAQEISQDHDSCHLLDQGVVTLLPAAEDDRRVCQKNASHGLHLCRLVCVCVCQLLTPFKMSRTYRMFSIMITPTTLRTMCIALVVLDALDRKERLSPSSPLTVSSKCHPLLGIKANFIY